MDLDFSLEKGDSPMYSVHLVVRDERGSDVGVYEGVKVVFPRNPLISMGAASGAIKAGDLVERFSDFLIAGTLIRCLTMPAYWAGRRPQPVPAPEPTGAWVATYFATAAEMLASMEAKKVR